MISKEQNLDPQHPIHHVRVHLSHAIEFQELPPIDLRVECYLLSKSQVCSHGSISTGRVEKAVAIRARKDATFFLQSAGIFLRSTSQSIPSQQDACHKFFLQPKLYTLNPIKRVPLSLQRNSHWEEIMPLHSKFLRVNHTLKHIISIRKCHMVQEIASKVLQ